MTTVTVTHGQNAAGSRVRSGWGKVTDVYLETTGSDDNDGTTPSTPIATLNEWRARFGDQFLEVSQTVHMGPGTFYAFDTLEPPGANGQDAPGFLTFKGTRTYVPGTHTVTAVQTWDGATHKEGIYTVPGISFATYNGVTGYFLEITGGPNAGAAITLGADLGSNQVQSAGGMLPDNATQVEPAVNDVVQLYSLTRIQVSTAPGAPFSVNVGNSTLIDLDIGGTVGDSGAGTAHDVTFWGSAWGAAAYSCILRGADFMSNGWYFLSGNIVIHAHLTGDGLFWTNNVFLWILEIRFGAYLELEGFNLFRDYHLQIGGTEGSGTVVVTDTLCISDPLRSFQLNDPGCVLRIQGGNGYAPFWIKNSGSSADGIAILVKSGSGIYYDAGTQPVLVGTTAAQYASVGGTAKTSGQIPFFNTANGAAFVVQQ